MSAALNQGSFSGGSIPYWIIPFHPFSSSFCRSCLEGDGGGVMIATHAPYSSTQTGSKADKIKIEACII